MDRIEDLLTGGRILRRAFLEAPHLCANRGSVVTAADDPGGVVFMIQRGVAYRSLTTPDGRRTISEVLLPTDIGGIDRMVMGPSDQEIVAASALSYRAVGSTVWRDLMKNHLVALRILALLAEQRRRLDHHVMSLARFDARERICAFVVGIYDRLRRSELVTRPTFNLPLNQDQWADHLGMTMVHVSRTLRRLREERLLVVDRQVSIILDLDAVRALARGSRSGPASARGGRAEARDDFYPSGEGSVARELKD